MVRAVSILSGIDIDWKEHGHLNKSTISYIRVIGNGLILVPELSI